MACAHMCSSEVIANSNAAATRGDSRGSSRMRAASASTVSSASAAPSSIALDGRPSAGHSNRNCDTEQVEQIAEMCVVAQHRVAVDRPRQHLLDGEGGADRGDHKRVHVLPQPTDDRLQFGEPLQCGESVDRGVLLSAAQNVPDHRMNRVRLGGKEVAEFHQPFRNPRTLVEKGAGGQERFQRCVDDGGHAGPAAHGRPCARGASRHRRRTPAHRREAAPPECQSRRSRGRGHATTHRCRRGPPSPRRHGRRRRCSRP